MLEPKVDRVVRHVFDLIHAYDLVGFQQLWSFLEVNFVTRTPFLP